MERQLGIVGMEKRKGSIKMKHRLISIILAIGLLAPMACTNNQKLATLEASLAATQVLLVTLEAQDPSHSELYGAISLAISGLPQAFQKTAV